MFVAKDEKLLVLDSMNGDIQGEVMVPNMFNHYPKPLIGEDGTVFSTNSSDVLTVTSPRKSKEQTEKNMQAALEAAKNEASGLPGDCTTATAGTPGDSAVGPPLSDVSVDDGFLIIGGLKLEIKK